MLTSAPAQLPLALKLRQGNDFKSFIDNGDDSLLPLLSHLSQGSENGQAFLYGAEGCGKSHLLEACVIAAEVVGRRAGLLSGEMLASLPINVLDGMTEFDLLLVDDVHRLASSPAWEEALFHLYNRCVQAGHSIIFAAQHAPRQCGFQLPDLITRLGAGPVIALNELDEKGLVQLLQQQASALGLDLQDEVAHYLLRRLPRQPAILKEKLNVLDQAALAQSRRLTIPFVKQQLEL